jgi:hypothetical protein
MVSKSIPIYKGQATFQTGHPISHTKVKLANIRGTHGKCSLTNSDELFGAARSLQAIDSLPAIYSNY